MFTGLISDVGVVERIAPRQGGVRLVLRPVALPVDDARAGRERGLLRRLPHGGGARRRAGVLRGGAGDPVPHHPRRLAPRHPRQPGAGAAPSATAWAATWCTATWTRSARCCAATAEGQGARLTISLPAEIAPLVAEKGSIAVDGISLTVAVAGRRSLRGGPHPGHAGAHHPGRGRAGDQGQPGGGPGGPPRGAPARRRRARRRLASRAPTWPLGLRRGGIAVSERIGAARDGAGGDRPWRPSGPAGWSS